MHHAARRARHPYDPPIPGLPPYLLPRPRLIAQSRNGSSAFWSILPFMISMTDLWCWRINPPYRLDAIGEDMFKQLTEHYEKLVRYVVFVASVGFFYRA